MEFEPASDGRARRAAREGRSPEPGRGRARLQEWEKARGSIRLRNQNTLGFGEQVELLLAASDAETRRRGVAARATACSSPASGTASSGYTTADKPRFFDGGGRRDQPRAASSGRASTWPCARRSSAGASSRRACASGASRPAPQAGVDAARGAATRWAPLFGERHARHARRPGLAASTARRLAVARRVEPGRTSAPTSSTGGAVRGPARARPLGARAGAAARRPRRASRASDLPVYDWYRLGGVDARSPGYHHEELKGAQALAAALSLRYTARRAAAARGARRGRQRLRRRPSDITPRRPALGRRASASYHPSPHRPGLGRDGRPGRRLRRSRRSSVGWH